MTNQTKNNYFLYDPEGYGTEFFSTKDQLDQAAATAIAEYKDEDGWSEYVDDIIIGEVTGKATAVNITHPVGEINEEGYDEHGEYWPEDCTEKCQYKIMPLDYKPALPRTSVAHPGCKFYICSINFKTEQGESVKTSSPADENGLNMATMMMGALVYVHGYEGALEIAKKAADKYKHTWTE